MYCETELSRLMSVSEMNNVILKEMNVRLLLLTSFNLIISTVPIL